ncbi:MAG: hypothetical protein CBC13_11040 [Planctomycetia bacterium TMED53]|nr:MAG: hypothetical protein CBC13_11040 [Planctomycetia bacterium TMED53]
MLLALAASKATYCWLPAATDTDKASNSGVARNMVLLGVVQMQRKSACLKETHDFMAMQNVDDLQHS